ncbi:helix-turn-helix domain-containing protein [Actinomadura kijaniata]|uniref:helix-turn-helix domain-containing protein n=1 Tax=Actinomadura kijaniata TaxID=46161 RepID=UPI0008319A8F|nr:helix-turn-helix transcriptional regulator [Actinomadura kijaniata]
MTTDQGPVVQSALLRSELTQLRKERGMTQEQVAKALEWSTSKVIRVEGGKSSITRTDLQALLLVYGVTNESRQERLQSLARGAREPAWWNSYKGVLSDAFLNFVGYEAGSSFIRQFTSMLIPGLLQTREYAEVFSTGIVDATTRGMAIRLRMQRQEELSARENPPRQFFVLDEAAIRRHVGVRTDPAIMPNQLLRIAERAESDDLVTVRIIPFSAGMHLGVYGPFTILEFDGGLSDILFIEGRPDVGADVTVAGDDPLVVDYRNNFETLLDEALSAEESIALLRRAADDFMA